MSVFERGETYVHRIEIRARNKQKTNPTTITDTIYGPCSYTLINAASMTSDATGEYYYNYAVPSAATYGRYKTRVAATSSGGNVAVFEGEFHVMPWKLQKTVRRITGIDDEKTISDDDLSHLSWMSYQEALRDVYSHAYKETPNGNPDTGVGFNGSNTAFQTRRYPVADSNGDGRITGTGTSCATDISGWWINSAGSRDSLYITVTQPDNGEITVYQSDGATAIPSDNEGVYIDYWY